MRRLAPRNVTVAPRGSVWLPGNASVPMDTLTRTQVVYLCVIWSVSTASVPRQMCAFVMKASSSKSREFARSLVVWSVMELVILKANAPLESAQRRLSEYAFSILMNVEFKTFCNRSEHIFSESSTGQAL